jgi:hypothetical protein
MTTLEITHETHLYLDIWVGANGWHKVRPIWHDSDTVRPEMTQPGEVGRA